MKTTLKIGIAAALVAIAVISPRLTAQGTTNPNWILCVAAPPAAPQTANPLDPQLWVQAYGYGFNEATQQDEILTPGWVGTSCVLHAVSQTKCFGIPDIWLPDTGPPNFTNSFWNLDGTPPADTLQTVVFINAEEEMEIWNPDPITGQNGSKDFPPNYAYASLSWFGTTIIATAQVQDGGLPANHSLVQNFVFIVIPAS